jgi:hypothetical protein
VHPPRASHAAELAGVQTAEAVDADRTRPGKKYRPVGWDVHVQVNCYCMERTRVLGFTRQKVHSYRSLYTERARTGMCVDCVSMLQILVANDPIRSHQVRIWVGSAIEG